MEMGGLSGWFFLSGQFYHQHYGIAVILMTELFFLLSKLRMWISYIYIFFGLTSSYLIRLIGIPFVFRAAVPWVGK